MPSRLHRPGSSHQVAQRLGTTRYNHCAELCQLVFQRLYLAFSKARDTTKRSGATSRKCASSIESLVRRSSLARLSCTMFNVPLVWDWGSVLSPIDQGAQLPSPCPRLSALRRRNQRKGHLIIGFSSLMTLRRCSRRRPNLWEQVRADAG